MVINGSTLKYTGVDVKGSQRFKSDIEPWRTKVKKKKTTEFFRMGTMTQGKKKERYFLGKQNGGSGGSTHWNLCRNAVLRYAPRGVNPHLDSQQML